MPIVTIDTDRLQHLIESASEFSTEPGSEADIIELIQAEKEVTAALAQVKAAFKEKLQELELNSVEGDSVRVTVSPSGSRYRLTNSQIAHPSLLKIGIDTEAVDQFVTENNTLPQGFDYNDTRGISVRLTIKKGTHD